MKNKLISIIIPVFEESRIINNTISSIYENSPDSTFEIIVIDGKDENNTINAIKDNSVKKHSSPRGRGIQMNRGAKEAKGEVLLFLHADTFLPFGGIEEIVSIMNSSSVMGGAFCLGLDGQGTGFRLIELFANLRTKLLRIPYGDQAIFISKEYFERIGRYREIPIMEDLDLMKRIKKRKGNIKIINRKVKTSSRRWEKEGLLYATVRNWITAILFQLGIPPEKLVRWYYPGFYDTGK